MSSYVPGPTEHYRYVTHPARCNRRQCQARRNLAKHPALYRQWPKCKVCGKGRMYVDWYRMKKGPRDKAPVCQDAQCGYAVTHYGNTGVYLPFHRVDTRGCSGYEAYMTESTMTPSRHSPIKPETGAEAPF